jgi:dynein light intermediate chain 1, cytosolic
MATTTSRPSSPTQDLWSSILDSVSNSKSIPSKQILLLGEPHTGKTTLAASLLQKEVNPDHSKDDFALGFDWADVRDDADEGEYTPFHRHILTRNNL